MSTTRKILIFLALLNFAESAHAQSWSLLATSTDNNAITADDEALYALKDTGNVWRYDGNSWELVDNGTATKQIVANTYLYVLKNSGNIWLRQNGQWRMIDSGVATRQIAASGNSIWVLKDNGEIWHAESNGSNWTRIESLSSMNNITIHAYGAYLIVARYNGDILRYFTINGTAETVGRGLIASAITGNSSDIYVRTTDGQVWGYESSAWRSLGMGTDNDTLALAPPYLWIKKFNGAMWQYRKIEGPARQIDPAQDTRAIAAAAGKLYFLKFSGYIWRLVP